MPLSGTSSRASRPFIFAGFVEHHPYTNVAHGTGKMGANSERNRCHNPVFSIQQAIPLRRACAVAIQKPSNFFIMSVGGVAAHASGLPVCQSAKDFTDCVCLTHENSDPRKTSLLRNHRSGKVSSNP